MRSALGLCLVLLVLPGGCRRSGLYASRSIPAAPAASAGAEPRFVGLWASSAGQCQDPVVLEARSLRAGGSDCDFDKVETSSAGYAVVAVCHSPGGLNPTRLTIATPNQTRISTLTIAGGPFKDAAALQRCAAP